MRSAGVVGAQRQGAILELTGGAELKMGQGGATAQAAQPDRRAPPHPP